MRCAAVRHTHVRYLDRDDSGRTHCKYIIDRRSLIRDIAREQTESTQAIRGQTTSPAFPTTLIPIYTRWYAEQVRMIREKTKDWYLIKTQRSCYKVKIIVRGVIDVL